MTRSGRIAQSGASAAARSRCGSSEMQDVALCVAAADAVRYGRQRSQEPLGGCEVAPAEGDEDAARRQSDQPRHVVVRARGAREATLLRGEEAARAIGASPA